MAANSRQKHMSENLAGHIQKCYTTVIVTVLLVTLSLPDWNHKAPFPVGWDDTSLPDSNQNCVHTLDHILTTRPQQFARDATDPSRFSTLQPAHRQPSLLN